MKKVKRGPPYDDDPGCKYIVIEDPWPGNATGKARDERYYNYLCAWVRFMLNKEFEVECVYSVNTRNEVIVQVPQDVDLVPILGAHIWRKILTRGNPKDKDRISYVFAYDYRNKGDPAKHQWLETYSTVNGDPPAYLDFPVVFPYPRPSWASPKGKNCVDLALPLPPTRQLTPTPDTSLFVPYQHPSQLSADTLSNAEIERRQQQQQAPSASSKLGKLDPYEEANALHDIRGELQDVKQHIKDESTDIRVKTESLKREDEPYAPSKVFRSTIQQLQQARASGAGEGLPATAADKSISNNNVKPEEQPSAPSEAFVAAIKKIQGAQAPQASVHEPPKMKGESDEVPYQPSAEFASAIQRLRGPSNVVIDEQPSREPIGANTTVKPDPEAGNVPTAQSRDPRVKYEPVNQERTSSSSGKSTVPPRRDEQVSSVLTKRVKEEDRLEPAKRLKK